MSDDLKRRIGKRLRALRESRALSQEDVAAAIDRSVETVSNIERGRVLAALETLDRLSRRLDVPLVDFFDDGEAVVSPARAATDMRLREVLRGLSDQEAEVALRQVEALTLLRRDGKRP
jgi:transcriptional regulator with XRE-family HTH domain